MALPPNQNLMNINPQQKKGSGFVNLGKVLGANTNNQLGSTVASGITNQAQGVKSDIGQAKTGFENEANANNLASEGNKAVRQQALSNIANYGQGQQPEPRIAQPGDIHTLGPESLNQQNPVPGKGLVSDDQAKQFGTFLAGKYAGPTGLDQSKVAQIGAKAQEAQGFGNALKSGGDKSGVLQAFAANKQGPYTAGQGRLDSLLLGKGPGAQALAGAQQQTRGLTQQLGREQENAQQIGQLRTGQAQQFGKDTAEQIGGQKTGIETNVGTELGKQQEAQKTAYDAINGKLQRGEALSPAERSTLGLSGGPMDVYNLNTADYLSKADINASNVASQQQKAQLAALGKLSGQNLQDFTKINTAEAGQYDKNKALGYDVNKLKSDADIKRQQYQSELNKGLGFNLGGGLEDKSNTFDIAGHLLNPLGTPDIFGKASAEGALALRPKDNNHNLYEYADALKDAPDIGNMNYAQATQAVKDWEQKIQPFKDRVENGINGGDRQSKTKEENLKAAYDELIPRLNQVKQQLSDYSTNLNKQYGIGKQL